MIVRPAHGPTRQTDPRFEDEGLRSEWGGNLYASREGTGSVRHLIRPGRNQVDLEAFEEAHNCSKQRP